MVRIDRLVMQGFKSFANRTVLPFPSGFNVICGPNGSGKSNVIDALLFVLGIRSTKAIRSEKLEDLIFNGGKNREGADYAAVSLYIDNTDSTIPGEPPEVKVTRKINRSGTSIYKLNGETVTRRRIVDVLSNARIFADGHNIIMQGDVTSLIEMNPEERRGIIDEISGIAEFDDKRTKAEAELGKVEEKLKEARIILNEKKNLLEKLKKEHEFASEAQRLEADARKLGASVLKRRLTELQGRIAMVQKSIDDESAHLQKLEDALSEYDKKLDERQREVGKATVEVFRQSRNKELTEKIHNLFYETERKKARMDGNLREIARLEELLVRDGGAETTVIKLNKKGVFGTIGGLLSVDERFTTAAEVAAGGHWNDIIVDTDQTASECIEHLKKIRVGRATFLPLNKLDYKENRSSKDLLGKPGVVDLLLNLVKYDKKYELAFRHVFADTAVVDTLQNARKLMGRARMVTLEGDLILPSGAMTGGFWKRQAGGSGYQKQRDELVKENSGLEEEIKILKDQYDGLKEKEERDSLQITDFERLVGKAEEEIKTFRKERQDVYEKMLQAKGKIGNFSIQRARLEAENDNVATEFREFSDVTEFYNADIQAMVDKRKDALEKLRKIGPVNMKAISDYEELRILYEDLDKKIKKIDEEKAAVLKMVEVIESRRREVFMEAFDAAKNNFASIFKDLNGGDAWLELEDENDIRTGLMIKAKPEGKREVNLDSMSGGEKTITALSFLFAVQLYKPAPFYILDEIDAALDKKNSKKIAELIHKYSRGAQFILITHNDTTIRLADRVYGVSMEEGASKVMALELPVN